MITSGFYKITDEYIDLIQRLGGIYHDRKSRPMYCCMPDKHIQGLFWAIPTSDLAHRSQKQIERIQSFIELPDRDIRSCYYHIGHTDRPAIFKISNVLPVTSQYISGEYISQGRHLILKDTDLINELLQKTSRILLTEQTHPNKFEQRITDIRNYLVQENSQRSIS